jgi:broad specificity phosphatase PhoE
VKSYEENKLKLVLARHGETCWNVLGRYQGGADIPLSERGLAQARQLARQIRQLAGPANCRLVLSSDLARAIQTAAAMGVPIIQTPHWRELDFGQWTGKTYNELAESGERERLHNWYNDPWHVAPPGGETLVELELRVRSGLRQVIKLLGAGRSCKVLTVFTHAGPIRLASILLSGRWRQAAQFWSLSIPNGAYLTYDLTMNELRAAAQHVRGHPRD